MTLHKCDLGAGLRFQGLYRQGFTETPLDRWGGLESLLDIHETDAVMQSLVRLVHSFAANSMYLNIDDSDAAEFGELPRLPLLDGEDTAVERVWLGERPTASWNAPSATQFTARASCDCSPGPTTDRQVEDTPQDLTIPFTIKHICHQPETGPQLVIEADNLDFYRLYRQYMGEHHPEDAAGPTIPALRDPVRRIKLLCVGVERLDVGLDDFEAMMQSYGCEDYTGACTQWLLPRRASVRRGDDRGVSVTGRVWAG
ncbi:hypothetical protein MMC26_002029 [Xylographa opegraphella]|nr:hypothetical protein [Xylographa opegraphella]